MLYIFFGSDDYSKKLHLERLTRGLGLPVEYIDGEADARSIVGGDLFGGVKVFVVRNSFSTLITEDTLEAIKSSPNHIIALEESLDKRLTFIKKILKDPNGIVQEFPLPEGSGLVDWVLSRTTDSGGNIDKQTAGALLDRLGVPVANARGFNTESKVSLWQIDSELQKLTIYAAGEKITKEMVDALVPESIETQSFDILNALGEKNRQKVFLLCEQLFQDLGPTEEKTKCIQLTALLADQFRNIIITQGLTQERVSDQEILAQTGWKPGRLFVMKKIASRFDRQKVLDTLGRLQNLDVELKTATTPAHVIIDLIFSQIV